MRSAFLATTALLFLAACDDEIRLPVQEVSDAVSPDYCGMNELMELSCVGCHGPGDTEPELTDIADVIDVESGYDGEIYVVPGDAAASFLYAKCAGTQDDKGSPMPLGGSISDENVDAIAAWIDAGATTECEGR
ncbi:MAG: cytochrome c553 [Cognaticolwellia sp.]|jgi:cytochrome c553